MKWMTVMVLFVCSGCAVQLTQAGSRVKVMKADPPADCSEIGPVQGGSGVASIDPQNIEYGKNAMRNSAASMGANYVRWDLVDHTGLVSGTAFKCPKPEAH